MYLREIAVVTTGSTVMGSYEASGVTGNQGRIENSSSGLDDRFMGEVVHAAAGMKREDANQLVKDILPKLKKAGAQGIVEYCIHIDPALLGQARYRGLL